MKLPDYIKKVSVVRTKVGCYTPMIHYEGKKPKQADKWLQKHGKRMMEILLGFKVKQLG